MSFSICTQFLVLYKEIFYKLFPPKNEVKQILGLKCLGLKITCFWWKKRQPNTSWCAQIVLNFFKFFKLTVFHFKRTKPKISYFSNHIHFPPHYKQTIQVVVKPSSCKQHSIRMLGNIPLVLPVVCQYSVLKGAHSFTTAT